MNSLLSLPFHIAFSVFKTTASILCNVEVTARHSLVGGTFKPFKSDIDMSIFVRNQGEVIRFHRLYRIAKFLFPWFGEYVRYDEPRLQYLNDHLLNGFEIDRDPALKAKLRQFSYSSYYFSQHHAISYLQTALIADYKNLSRNPDQRITKWRFHFEHVNRLVKNSELVLYENDIVISILTGMMRLMSFQDRAEGELVRVKLGVWIDYVAGQNHTVDLGPLIASEPMLWVFFPAMCASSGAMPPKISEQHMPVLLAGLDRELLSLLRNPENSAATIDSLETLSDALVDIAQKNPSPGLDAQLSKVQRLLAVVCL